MQNATDCSPVNDPVDEFELPNRAIRIARSITDLLSQHHEQSQAAKENGETVIVRIDAIREKSGTIFARTTASISSKGLIVSDAGQQQSSKDAASISDKTYTLRECERDLTEMTRLSEILQKSVPPAYTPHSNGGKLVLLAAIIVSAVWFYFGALLWFPCRWVMRVAWLREHGASFEELAAIERRLSRNLDALREEVSRKTTAISEALAQMTKARSQELRKEIDVLIKDSGFAVEEWDSPSWDSWSPDTYPEFAARIGTFHIDGTDPARPLLNLSFKLPALVPFGNGKGLLIDASDSDKQMASDAMLSAMIRILATTPAGKARFTFIDPVGLGQNAADFLHLGDLNKELISGKAWSEPRHIEQQLLLLTEHIETIIQTCLRNEFQSIREYNRERQDITEPFRFLVINDFPVNFTDDAARRLVSIVRNGPRCGVFTFIVRDTTKKLPHNFNISDLQIGSTVIYPNRHNSHRWRFGALEECGFTIDDKPPADITKRIVATAGKLAITAMKIEVPFARALDAANLDRESWWKASATDCFKVPLGPAGGRAIQYFTLGGEQEAHALLVGRTGSGKTNLMHVLLTALALRYPPGEIELYLIDFKGGVGFKRYAEYCLPHAKVIAIESEREFGMSVLQGIDTEIKRRSDLFRAAGVDSLAGFRAKAQTDKPLPRILLIVDEFQEFFSDNDDLSQQAKTIFDRIARQGRSFGIHFLLATQSLSGSAHLPASIMGQIKVRIALPCSEADSRLIFSEDNKAARALSQPGEAIYNAMAGLVEGNNRFQVARFSDEDLPRYLQIISESVGKDRSPIIFEGNRLADLKDCARLAELANAPSLPASLRGINLFLGEPIAILPSVAATLRRQSGRNLLAVTREESEGAALCVCACVSIISQMPPAKARIHVLDFSTADSGFTRYAPEVASLFSGMTSVINRQRDVAPFLASLAKEVDSRGHSAANDSIFVIIQGMHRIKPLRDDSEDDNGDNAVESLKHILRDGPEVGVHTIAWADTISNAARGIGNKALGEFAIRIAWAMDSGDSMNFIDSLAASKLSKPHRALFYDEDRPGQLATFRPYALPEIAWLKETGLRLKSRGGEPNAPIST